MKIFLDTEFTGLHQHTTLISIGLAAENGDLFYGELTDFDAKQADEPWIITNVLRQLSGPKLPNATAIEISSQSFMRGSRQDIANALRLWIGRFGGKGTVQIWADVLAWDWVLFCELFGGAFNIPEQVSYIPGDLSTLLWAKGIPPDTEREMLGNVQYTHEKLVLNKHHALYDALLELDIFNKI